MSMATTIIKDTKTATDFMFLRLEMNQDKLRRGPTMLIKDDHPDFI